MITNRQLSMVFGALFFCLFACNTSQQNPAGNNNSGGSGGVSGTWLVPQNEVFDGGPGKDGIPALENPAVSPATDIGFLTGSDLVIGFCENGVYRAYPHDILDWHEIINDELEGMPVAITYCPLTGTGIGWERMISGQQTTFGVSGLLYNTNLIPYDRLTDSKWCQISLKSINGNLIGEEIKTVPIVETTWQTWKAMFPESTVVNTKTGFSRNYGIYPYGDYKTNNNKLLFPVSPMDTRLPEKERVLAVVVNDKSKVYQRGLFEGGTKVITDQFENTDIVVIGNKEKNIIVAYENSLDGSPRQFAPATSTDAPAYFKDDLGNEYDVFGSVISGPDVGKRLLPTNSFMAYWFSIGAFYPNAAIYN